MGTLDAISTSESALTRFFGIEPRRSDEGVPWPYCGLSYAWGEGSAEMAFEVSPSYKSVNLSIRVDGTELFQFKASRLRDLVVHMGPSHDTLELAISDANSIFIRLAPALLITQQADNGV